MKYLANFDIKVAGVQVAAGGLINTDDVNGEYLARIGRASRVDDDDPRVTALGEAVAVPVVTMAQQPGQIAQVLTNVAPPSPPPADLSKLDGSIPDLETYVATVSDADVLKALRDAETKGKNRAGALAAIDTRSEALKG